MSGRNVEHVIEKCIEFVYALRCVNWLAPVHCWIRCAHQKNDNYEWLLIGECVADIVWSECRMRCEQQNVIESGSLRMFIECQLIMLSACRTKIKSHIFVINRATFSAQHPQTMQTNKIPRNTGVGTDIDIYRHFQFGRSCISTRH